MTAYTLGYFMCGGCGIFYPLIIKIDQDTKKIMLDFTTPADFMIGVKVSPPVTPGDAMRH